MSFREKSAWVMAVLMSAAGLYYLERVVGAWRAGGVDAPAQGPLIAYVILVVIGSVIAQAALASTSPKEANAPADERERPALDKAGHWSGIVLGVGAVGALFHFLYYGDGNMLFHLVMGSLIVSQIAEYGFQILLLRRSA